MLFVFCFRCKVTTSKPNGQTFSQLFSKLFFAAFIYASTNARTYAHAHAHIHEINTIIEAFIWKTHTNHKAHEKRLICSFTIFNKRFFRNYLFVW